MGLAGQYQDDGYGASTRFGLKSQKNLDFANSGAYLAGVTPENTTKFVMTGANKSTYEAHVLGTCLAYKFWVTGKLSQAI